MNTALQVSKAIEILSKYEDISICAEHDEIYLSVGYKNTVSLEDEIYLKDLRFRETDHNCWAKFV